MHFAGYERNLLRFEQNEIKNEKQEPNDYQFHKIFGFYI